MGVNISTSKLDELSLFEENFANIIHDMQSVLNLWCVRGLTLLGKKAVFKTLVISRISHKTLYLPMHLPEAFIKQLDKLMIKFIKSFK